MRESINVLVIFLGYLCLSTELISAHPNVTLVVLGRNGAEISSTVNQLIGLKRTILHPSKTKVPSFIKEYAVPIKSEGVSFLNIVEVAGMVDGQTLDQDVKVLSQLKSYLLDPLKLSGSLPNSILFVTKFDDLHFNGSQSALIRTLGRLEALQKSVYGSVKIANIGIVATRLMTALPAEQRKFEKRIQNFQKAISRFSSFPNVSISVGENKGSEYNLPETYGGFTRLPNGAIYPRNVIDSLILLAAEQEEDALAESALWSLLQSRSSSTSVTLTYYNSDKYSSNYELELYLRLRYDSITDENIKLLTQNALQPLINVLRGENIKNRSQLSRSAVRKAALFQSVNYQPASLQPGIKLLLKTLLDIEVVSDNHKNRPPTCPRVTTPPSEPLQRLTDYTANTAGQGYDLLNELVLPNSPFNLEGFNPKSTILRSEVKEIPRTEQCQRITYKNVANKTAYFRMRLYGNLPQELHASFNSSSLQLHNFIGEILPGYNVKGIHPKKTCRIEVETIMGDMTISDGTSFTDEFTRVVAQLPKDVYSCEEKRKWKKFFTEFGTHYIRSASYGTGFEFNLHGLNSQECIEALPTQYALCKTNSLEFLLERNITVKKPLKTTFELEYIGTLIRQIDSLKYAKLNTAFGDLLINGLVC